MTRQDKLKEIGEMKLEEEGYSLKVIIPCPHNFYKNNEAIFDKIEQSGWKIVNEATTRQFGAYNIKPYIYDNVIPKLNENKKSKFIDDNKTLLLKKELNQQCSYLKKLKDNDTFELDFNFIIKNIDLWIFDEHICFFVLNIELEDFTKYKIDELTLIQNKLRNFKFVSIEMEKEKYIFKPAGYEESYDFINKLIELTMVENKSFLDICLNDCNLLRINKKINSLFSIYNSSTNAKLLIGMQIKDTEFSDGTAIEEVDPDYIGFINTKELALISEIPFYIATCSSLNPSKDWTHKDDYIYACTETGGFGIWKYSAGITIYDSAAFVGLSKDGGRIVDNVNNVFYFIYMLNLYINMQTRFIEHQIIDDSFESLEIKYWYKKLQKLKNQFVANDVAVKFQENELNNSMLNALETKDILSEVSENLVNTKEITQSNIGLYVTIGAFMFTSIFQDLLTKLITVYKYEALGLALIGGTLAFKYRKNIKKFFKI